MDPIHSFYYGNLLDARRQYSSGAKVMLASSSFREPSFFTRLFSKNRFVRRFFSIISTCAHQAPNMYPVPYLASRAPPPVASGTTQSLQLHGGAASSPARSRRSRPEKAKGTTTNPVSHPYPPLPFLAFNVFFPYPSPSYFEVVVRPRKRACRSSARSGKRKRAKHEPKRTKMEKKAQKARTS